MRKVDVVVCGAGIAASITSALLAHKGIKVLMLDRAEGQTNHLPESWFYTALSSFKLLGLEEKIATAMHPQASVVFSSTDGSCSLEVSSRGLWSVDRNHLDKILLDAAFERGVETLFKTQIVGCEVSDSESVLHVKKGEESQSISTSWLIDATGKSAFLSHHLKLPMKETKLDPRLAYFSHFEALTSMPKAMIIVAIPGGYLFCIPIAKQRVSVGCVLAEGAVDTKASADQMFTAALASSSYLMQLLSGAKRVLPVIAAKNHKRICLAVAGHAYRLVGDAAAFLDPFFCPGIDFAVFSAEQAVLSIERNDPEGYGIALMNWLAESEGSIYQKMQRSTWQDVMRLFADPHLPWAIPSMLTQSFTRIVGNSLEERIVEARKSYEMAHA